MSQILQIAGAVLILSAFIGAQVRAFDPRSYPYLLLNLVGSALLAVLAGRDQQWGFLLLETVWAVVSLGGFIARLRGRPAAVPHDV